MLKDIKKIIPEVNKNDSQKFYNDAVKTDERKKFTFSNKMILSIVSSIILLLIVIPVGVILLNNDEHTSNEDKNNQDNINQEENNDNNPDNEEISDYYNLQGVILEFYDCYFGENSDVLVLYLPEITLFNIYIKEVNIDNKIIGVEIKNENKEVKFENGVYIVDVSGLDETFISIHFAPGTLEGNKIIQDNIVDDEPNVDADMEHITNNDEYYENNKSSITMLMFLCSITMPDAGYEKVTYMKKYDYIKDEPLINIFGIAETVEEAMDKVGLDRILVFNDENRINRIVYNKNNSFTEIVIDYDVNSFITIRAIKQHDVTLDDIATRYVDTYLYLLEEEYYTYDNGCTGDLYVCFKNDDDFKSAFAVLEYLDGFNLYYYVVQIDLYGDDLNYSFKEILNKYTYILEK